MLIRSFFLVPVTVCLFVVVVVVVVVVRVGERVMLN